MLPQIARLTLNTTVRGRLLLATFALGLLGLPTLYVEAQLGPVRPVSKPRESVPPGPIQRTPLPPMAAPGVEYLPEETGEEKAILEALEQTVDFEFEQVQLQDIVTTLSDKYKVRTYLDLMQMQEAGLDPQQNDVTLKISGISLKSALKLLLHPRQLDYILEDEVLKITSRTAAIETRVTRTYPVSDLIGNVDADYELLARAIEQSTCGSPHAPWMASEGEGGTVSIMPAAGCLVIRQTTAGHAQILTMLRGLRKASNEMRPKPL